MQDSEFPSSHLVISHR